MKFEGSAEILGSEGTANISDEKTLIRLAQNGDIRAFEKLVKQYQRRVISVSYRIVGDVEDARDVAQEVFVRLYRFLSQFRNERKFFTWLYRIIVNVSFDFLKREKRFLSLPLDEIPEYSRFLMTDDEAQDGEISDKIYKLTEMLSIPQKTAFILREVEGFKCREIAKIMDCPSGTVRSHLHHARRRLKELIEKHYPEFIEGMNREVSKS